MTASEWSDLSGFASGVCLVYTAWRNDGLLSFVDSVRTDLNKPENKDKPTDKKAEMVIASLEKEATTWSGRDRWALRVGVAMLLASYAIKALPPMLAWAWSVFNPN
jgi:hypothetical protein